MRQWGYISATFVVFMCMVFVMTSEAFAATEEWYSSSANWTQAEKWYDGSVPVAPMASGDTIDFGNRKPGTGTCYLTTNAGDFAARLYMHDDNTLHIQNGGSVGFGWGRVGNYTAAAINISGNGSLHLNDDDIYFGVDGGHGELKMYDSSSLTTISTDSEPDTLHLSAYADGSTSLFQLNGSNITVDVDEFHILSNQWSGTSNMEATLEYVLDADGASTIITGQTGIGEGNGTAHLVITAPGVTLGFEDIVLIENTWTGAIAGTGVFTDVNNSFATEGELVYLNDNIYSLTYQYDATGDGADNDIALVFVGTGTNPNASDPSPVPGEVTDPDNTVLSWQSASGIVRNEIYLGKDQVAVTTAQKPAGDVDGDGLVGFSDLTEVAIQWLGVPSDPCPDLDYSGVVDLPDLAKVGSDWQGYVDEIYVGSTNGSIFDPVLLDAGAHYYWRVDSVFCDGIVPGPVWNFQTKTPAFPGAEGFGKWASGGRGGSVYHVTNLNDSGPGSFRDAVSVSNRTVVFDVGGIINIDSRIVVDNDITIAGQTAPGEGVMIYGDGLSYTHADRTITRYMRYRMGLGGTVDKDAVGVADGQDMIFDHCSITWGRDENFSVNEDTPADPGLITIQDSIVGQGLMNHSCGGFSVDWDDGISILRCLYIDNDTRNPKVRGINEFINNVVYNWDDGGYIMAWTTSTTDYSYVNAINNYFIGGPDVDETTPFRYGNTAFHIYHSNNWYDYDEDGVFDGRVLTDADYTWNNETVVDDPFDYPGVKTLLSPRAAVKSIASVCGPSFPVRDRTDKRLIDELTSYGTSGQFISNENNAPMYGVGTIANGINPIDTDQDGMPDYWEDSIDGLNPAVADNNGDVNGNGYTNLEDYINWLADYHADVPRNAYTDIDLRLFTSGFNSGATYIISEASHGTAAKQADGYTVRYTPETDYVGIAEFSFTINDGGDMMTKTVHLLVSEYGGNPLSPMYPDNPTSGLQYRYYTGSWQYLPEFSILTPVQTGTISNFDITSSPNADTFAYEFEGYIDVPTDGQYTFYTTSDDGSRLFIDDGVVVSNDGIHPAMDAQGKVALLAGMHKIRVTYFENSGGQTLEVDWAGPGFTRQFISNGSLYYSN